MSPPKNPVRFKHRAIHLLAFHTGGLIFQPIDLAVWESLQGQPQAAGGFVTNHTVIAHLPTAWAQAYRDMQVKIKPAISIAFENGSPVHRELGNIHEYITHRVLPKLESFL